MKNQPPQINLNIDRITLDGISFSLGERHQFRSALEVELARLVSEKGLSPTLSQGIAVPSLPSTDIQGMNPTPTGLGQQIARAIYESIGSHDTTR